MYISKREGCALILASSSPRRKQLLEQLGIEFEVAPVEVPENPENGADPAEEAKRIARDKAQAAAKLHQGDRWILAADTMVIINGDILGKPSDQREAEKMLARLSGNVHKVVTGWHIMRADGSQDRSGSVESSVLIKALKPQHIRAYARTGEPMDKAGAYAVQGVGAFMVSRIEGSYTNVVGLPLSEVVEALEELDVIRLKAG